jgi:hypothetical protein
MPVMSTLFAEAELAGPVRIGDVARSAVVGFDEFDADEEQRLSAVRGIAAAVLISLPFWGLVAFTVYVLL